MNYFAEITPRSAEFLNVQIPEPGEKLKSIFKIMKQSAIKKCKIATYGDYGHETEEVKVIRSIRYKDRIIVIHAGWNYKYTASDYETGYALGSSGNNIRKVIEFAKLIMDKAIERYLYDKLERINP